MLMVNRATSVYRLVRRAMSSSSASSPLILSPEQVKQLQHSGSAVKLLDASWFMPNSAREAALDFIKKRAAGASFLDLDKVASPHELGLKHMMPSKTIFAEFCETNGITPTTSVILYDTHGVFSSPRALFMFRSFGHANSSILNGGLPLWEDAGLAIESGDPVQSQLVHYPLPKLDANVIRDYHQMVQNASLESGAEIVLDARSLGRYLGTDPEPRPGLSSGHMPHSCSLPFNMFLQSQLTSSGTSFTTMRPVAEIQQALIDAVGEDRAQDIMQGKVPVTTTCGSGMTAAVLWLGLKLVGAQKVALYDESWTGYAMRPSSVIQKQN